jgi:Fe-S cluster biogenesis protein NfuA
MTSPLREPILRALDTVRAAMGADGGGVELEYADNHVVRVRLIGACRFCPSRSLTIDHTLAPLLQDCIPDGTRLEFCRLISSLVDMTDRPIRACRST